MGNMQCNVEFGYQLSICCGTKKNHGKPLSNWPVAGPFGCKTDSSQQSGIQSQRQSYITTDGQSASLSWCQAPVWDPRPIFLLSYFFQVAPQLYSRGRVNPVPDPLLLRKSGKAENRTRISGSVTRNSDH
jgi:hypothetical protein